MKLCPICSTSYPEGQRTCPTHGAVLVEADELQPGTMIRDCYRIERILGKGGMGSVYLATHVLMGEPRALKFLSPSLAGNPAFVQRFLQEARAAMKLRHANIAATLELGQAEGGGLYISMEYVEGPSLRAVLQSSPQGLATERAFAIIRGVAEGLGAAHARGLVHRDVKPENILLGTAQGSGPTAGRAVEIAKVVDFGIVAMSDAPGGLTQTGLPLLTAEYAAPEQWRGVVPSSQLDGRTDLYALGCMFFEVLTGRMPFHAESYEGWFERHVYAQPPSPSDLRPELAWFAGLDALVLRMLAKEREQRPANAAEFIAALDAIAAGAGQTRKLAPEYMAERPQGTPPTATLSRAQLNLKGGRPPEWTPAPQGVGPSLVNSGFGNSGAGIHQAGPGGNVASVGGHGAQPGQAGPGFGQAGPQAGFGQPGFGQAGFPQAGLPLRPPPPARKKSTIRMGVLFGILGTFLLLTVAVVGIFAYLRRGQGPQPDQGDPNAQTGSQTAGDTGAGAITDAGNAAPGADGTAGNPGAVPAPGVSGGTPGGPAASPGSPTGTSGTGTGSGAGKPAGHGPAAGGTAAPLTDPVSLAARAIALYNEKDYTAAAALLTQACSGGQADSCDYLGYAYLHKLGVNQDYSHAASAYEKGCQAGSMAACSHLAAMFQNSVGVGQDPAKARTLYTKACDGGLAEACQNLGRMLQSKVDGGQDLPKAVTVYGKACNSGNMAGCNSLGSLYQHGQGVEPDLPKALSLYEKACNANFADGCNNLGYMYQQNIGVERDYTRAAGFYEKACNGGNSFACNNLGIMYQDNEGVNRDYERAVSLYEKACTGGSSNGCSDLGELYRKGLGVAKDAEKARTYLSKGCDMGNKFGCDHMKLVQ